jgi:putative membrane protein
LRRRLVARWQGILLALIGIVATAWLAATDRLGLYIHPRYFWFTVIMAAIAAVLVVAAFALAPLAEPESHEHAPDASTRRSGSIRAALAATIVVGAAFALLVLPPATLTSATATQRSINSTGATLDRNVPVFAGGDTSQFTVKDWAMLLRQGPDADIHTSCQA